MFPEKTRFGGDAKNASTLLSSTCVFKYLKNKKFIHILRLPVRRRGVQWVHGRVSKKRSSCQS